MSREHDRELDELFEDDPELREVAHVLRSTPRPAVDPDPAFRANLRRRLMEEAWKAQVRDTSRAPWYRRLITAPARLAWSGQTAIMPRLAWSGGIAALLVIALIGIMLANRPASHQQVIVSIPIKNAQSVAVVKSIPVQFNQPMERKSTEKAISIQPATEVSYQWPSASQVEIAPKNGSLAPGTRYQVTVGPGASGVGGQRLTQAQTATFVTAPPPTPTPPSTPTPAPPSNPNPALVGQHRVGLIGNSPAAWANDGSQLYFIDPNGQLNVYSTATGATQALGQGASMVVATASGPAYALQNGDVVWNGQTLKGIDPAAIGVRAGKLLFVSGGQIVSADRSLRLPLSEDPTAAAFSPDGNRLAYIGASGLHLVDLATGKDRQVQRVQALGAWSPKAPAQYGYPDQNSIVFADGVQGGTRTISAAGVTGISWSQDDQLLLSGPAGLLIVPAAGGTPMPLSTDPITQPQWSPASDKSLSYDLGGALWVAQVSNGQQQLGTQQDVVSAFMLARQRGQVMQAQSFLDGPGQAAFQNVPLTYGNGQVLTRYQVLLDEPGHMVVRLVIDQNGGETAIDETLTLRRDGQGRVWINSASDAAPRPLGQGPEVVTVRVAGTQVTVTFDSDLDQSSIGGVTVAGLKASSVSYDARSRSIVLTYANGLDPNATYRLQVSSALHDVNRRAATPVTVTFTGLPGSSPSPTPSPSPSASPSPAGANPTPSPSPTP